ADLPGRRPAASTRSRRVVVSVSGIALPLRAPAPRSASWYHFKLTIMVVVKKRIVAAILFAVAAPAQQPEGPGKTSFETRCVLCHAGDGGRTDRAPSI